jgi:hypothetical protein
MKDAVCQRLDDGTIVRFIVDIDDRGGDGLPANNGRPKPPGGSKMEVRRIIGGKDAVLDSLVTMDVEREQQIIKDAAEKAASLNLGMVEYALGLSHEESAPLFGAFGSMFALDFAVEQGYVETDADTASFRAEYLSWIETGKDAMPA